MSATGVNQLVTNQRKLFRFLTKSVYLVFNYEPGYGNDMKSIATALTLAACLTATAIPAQAGNTFRLEYFRDYSGLQIGTDVYRHHNDYRHHGDLYVRDGYTSTGSAYCHRHVERTPGMQFHANTQCHRHDPWLHPSLDYAVR